MSEPAVVELNPAVAAAIAMPPALIRAIEEDPDLLAKLTRGQLAVVQEKLVRRALQDPEVTLSQLAAVHEALAKQVNLKGNQVQAVNPGGQISINFYVGGKKDSVVIEGQVADVTPG